MELIPSSSSTDNRSSFCYRGTTINHLPDDLLIEIFLRLPLKSAKQCTAVSKHWYALISTPYFGNRFLQMNYTSTLLFSEDIRRSEDSNKTEFTIRKLGSSSEDSIFRSQSFSFTYLPREPLAHPPVVVASFGDLLLCSDDVDYQKVYYICNPLTAEWIQVPPTPNHNDYSYYYGFICQGQGSSFKYSIVRLILGKPLQLCTFTSDSGIWRKQMYEIKFCEFKFTDRVGVPYEDTLVWITNTYDALFIVDPFSEGCASTRRTSIGRITLPQRPSPDWYVDRFAHLSLSKGTLRLVEITTNGEDDILCICVWDLDNFIKKEWNLEHFNILSGMISKHPTLKKYRYLLGGISIGPIACDTNNGVTLYLRINGTDIFLTYNMHMESLEVICEVADISANSALSFYALPWQPTSLPS